MEKEEAACALKEGVENRGPGRGVMEGRGKGGWGEGELCNCRDEGGGADS